MASAWVVAASAASWPCRPAAGGGGLRVSRLRRRLGALVDFADLRLVGLASAPGSPRATSRPSRPCCSLRRPRPHELLGRARRRATEREREHRNRQHQLLHKASTYDTVRVTRTTSRPLTEPPTRPNHCLPDTSIDASGHPPCSRSARARSRSRLRALHLERSPSRTRRRLERQQILMPQLADDLPRGHARVRRRAHGEHLPAGPARQIAQPAGRRRRPGRRTSAGRRCVDITAIDVDRHVDARWRSPTPRRASAGSACRRRRSARRPRRAAATRRSAPAAPATARAVSATAS